MGLPPASPYAVAGGWPGTTMFSESTASYTANHVPSMEQIRPDPNGVGACPRPALPGLGGDMFKIICPRQMISFG
jgi:hypothetical protein